VLVQIQSDADLYQREFERRLGNTHWTDPHWRAKPVPPWVEEVIQSGIDRASELALSESPWANADSRAHWREWLTDATNRFAQLKNTSRSLQADLERGDLAAATADYSKWSTGYGAWIRALNGAAGDYDRGLRQSFSTAESEVVQLKIGLEIVLVVVVAMSLLLLWLGERALRPLSDLARLAREITRRGLRKEDKTLLPEISLSRNDEVSQLTREFHRMASALLEREKMVETQKKRLQDQYDQLRDMGELNQNILNSIESILLVTDLEGRVTRFNPPAVQWLRAGPDSIRESLLSSWPQIRSFTDPDQQGGDTWLERIFKTGESLRIEPRLIGGKIYGGTLQPLRTADGKPRGSILVLDDLTDEIDLQNRLQHAEKMAAVGRLSAQVAHEVRNPLHSIGLETELAVELVQPGTDPRLKQSLASILSSVDRLEKITDNYLKLSRLTTGEKTVFDLGEVLEAVLATYSAAFEVQKVRVNWKREPNGSLMVSGDRDLLENAIGNLVRNSLQALASAEVKQPAIEVNLGTQLDGKVFLRIQDNGPGVSRTAREKLFTPFFTTRAEGTGLGLSFVRKVADDHGGSVQCLDWPEGQGAGFEMSLPAH